MRRCIDTIIHDQADGPVSVDTPVLPPLSEAAPEPVAAEADEPELVPSEPATLSAAVAATRRRRPASQE